LNKQEIYFITVLRNDLFASYFANQLHIELHIGNPSVLEKPRLNHNNH